MCEKVLFLTCLIAFAYSVDAASAPFITKCKADDTKCLKSSGQAAVPIFASGIPELNVETLDPLHYDNLDASAKNLKFLLSDLTILGVKGCDIKKLVRDVEKAKIYVKALCTVTLDGEYEMGGHLLILPIEGKGKIHVVLKKLLINVEADMGEKVKDGVKYWDIKTWKHTYELKDDAEIQLENLFNGNKALSGAVNSLLKTSPNEIVNEVGPPIIKALLTKVIKNVDHFFHKVPADELALD